ncbi:MAG: ribose 5-phosphate isomerase B [Alphaproteobacteria bacterium]|nr:ribose 5-phosphate isomerase B [Alphaproteobacteria bacterium]|tara:strand:- start:3987 stop:4421 length:435 start_codon:yes stop_codon:yes gene_type:complete
MPSKSIVIASDHAGYELKETLKQELSEMGFEVLDLGTDSQESVDYPDFGHAAAEAIVSGRAERGVIVCGTGIGISIAANRHPGVRAALCHDAELAKLSREHNDANLLAMGGRTTEVDVARACLKSFLETPYEGGRHDRRIAKLA